MKNSVELFSVYVAGLVGGFCIVPIDPEATEFTKNYIIETSKVHTIIKSNAYVNLENDYVDDYHFNFRENDRCCIFYTSGSSGSPKGVVHSFKNIISNAISFNNSQGVNSDCSMYHFLPMSYMAGYLNTLICPLLAGGSIVLKDKFNPFFATLFWDDFVASKANTIWVTPSIVNSLLLTFKDGFKFDSSYLSSVNFFCGTSQLFFEKKNKFYNLFGIRLQESYGMTEVLLISCQRSSEMKSNDVGRPLPEVSLDENLLNSSKELNIDVPWLFQSYITKHPKRLINGFFETGDLASVKEGIISIQGRRKDLIIKGGVNISPIQIEQIFFKCFDIKDVAVIGKYHDFWGEVPVAFIVLSDDSQKSLILAEYRSKLGAYINSNIHPEEIYFIDEIPKTDNGKNNKIELRNIL